MGTMNFLYCIFHYVDYALLETYASKQTQQIVLLLNSTNRLLGRGDVQLKSLGRERDLLSLKLSLIHI